MKIMLDTNILISAIVFGGASRKTFLKLLETEHEVLVSKYVVKEFHEKIHAKWPDKADEILGLFAMLPVNFCESTESMQGTLRDEKDIPILSDALYHNVDVILTGDKDFLEADLKKPVIFSMAMFLEYLEKHNNDQ